MARPEPVIHKVIMTLQMIADGLKGSPRDLARNEQFIQQRQYHISANFGDSTRIKENACTSYAGAWRAEEEEVDENVLLHCHVMMRPGGRSG
jgi:hypothetical protein